MGPQDSKDVTRNTARDLWALVGGLAALKGDATHWLTGPEYAALRHRLESAHAAAEAIGALLHETLLGSANPRVVPTYSRHPQRLRFVCALTSEANGASVFDEPHTELALLSSTKLCSTR
jgi:hypothetical protein